MSRDDDRPKKSWRELDRAKDKSSHRGSRNDPSERARERASRSHAYSQYKSQLDGLFKPGGTDLPESLKAKLGPTSESGKARKAALDALKNAPGEKTLRTVIDEGHPFPEDPRLLTGLLDVRDAALLRPVLEALLELVEAGKKPNRMLLIQRLQALENLVDDAPTLELANTLRAALD